LRAALVLAPIASVRRRVLRPLLVLVAMMVAGTTTAALAQAPSLDLLREIAPRGRLRAAINLGNPVLATREGGQLKGISVDLARELARRLTLDIELVPFDAAGKVTEAGRSGDWDIAFLAVDPVRAEGMTFTAPYLVIEGVYMVPEASSLRRVEDVDRPGNRISVGRGSAYDLHLTRAIKQAELVRAPTSTAAVELMAQNKLEVAANVRQLLVAYARDHAGYRIIEPRFMAIEQAMAVPAGRVQAIAYLKSFVEDVKASGFVADALVRNRQPDAVLAPPAGR
jgi:polar amino acid transport system substrate-binding protein